MRNKIITAKKLRRLLTLDDISFMYDEKFCEIAERLGMSTEFYASSIFDDIQPYQIGATGAGQCEIEGALGYYYAVEYDADSVTISVLDKMEGVEQSETGYYYLFPDSMYENNGEYLVTIFTGNKEMTLSVPGKMVEDGCVKVKISDFYTKVNREYTFDPHRNPVSTRWTMGEIKAKAGKYVSYVDKIYDQLNVLVASLIFKGAKSAEMVAVNAYLDVKLKELRRLKCKNQMLDILDRHYNLEGVIGGV